MANATTAMMSKATPMADPPKRNPTNMLAPSRCGGGSLLESREDAGGAEDRDYRPDQDSGEDRRPAVAPSSGSSR